MSERLARFILLPILILGASAPIAPLRAAAAEPTGETNQIGPAFIVPLFPQKEADLKKGLPPGITPYSFWAARGSVALTKRPDGKVKMEFDFAGLIPHGLYTLWNVLETTPFKDEPLGEFGAGKHSVVADASGVAHKLVVIDKWPGKEFLLDYHADGTLSQSKGVYPGVLWGRFPLEPKL